ncbi:hypothetical protein BBF96_14910 [Anoxybacter fermentans]|uniref:Uncharacterized protein n=1 Tax=Anoxybacter fermentans TaxID=1323375 RepID=A0A3Q9HSE1_9FIRM|nr:DUF4247 domain-containing protein [Anoxybacter fermentans]AZR74564.1 hypothetical protein BBF96_14910 [Anoxybacter fermentans]
MDRNQKITMGIFVTIVVIIFAINYTIKATQTIPDRISRLYPLHSQKNLTTGKLRIYMSNESPIPTAERILYQLGRPYEMTNLELWKNNPTEPILLLYDNYVVSIRELNGKGSQVEVTNYETAYDRYNSTFIYYWGPSVRRGSIFRIGPSRVRGGGIGGLGGK